MSELIYPRHIYDETRYQLAIDILEKELSKLLPTTSTEAWDRIKKDVEGWASSPLDYHLEDRTFMDFWDIFAAVLESIKLKPSFTKLITAENYRYSRKMVTIDDIHMSSALHQLTKIPTINLHNGISFSEIRNALKNEPKLLAEQRMINDSHSLDPEQDKYPVIVALKSDDYMQVMDGNRRTLRALLYGKKQIEAWVIEGLDEIPANYWVPVNDLMQLVELYKMAKKSKNNEYVKHIRYSLEAHFHFSAIAKINYESYILANNHSGGKELFDEKV